MVLLTDLPARDLLALCIWREAGGEPLTGQVAVGCVVRNRVRAAKALVDWRDVLLAEKQFSCFNPSDPNRPVIERAAQTILTALPIPAIRQAQWIADGIIAGSVLDVTKGATHYLVTQLLHSEHPPRWAKGVTPLIEIGHHSFLKVA